MLSDEEIRTLINDLQDEIVAPKTMIDETVECLNELLQLRAEVARLKTESVQEIQRLCDKASEGEDESVWVEICTDGPILHGTAYNDGMFDEGDMSELVAKLRELAGE